MTEMPMLFPFADYWWFYIAFVIFILAVLVLDLGVFHKKDHVVSFKEASAWTVVWISLALVFNFLFYHYALWKFSSDATLLAIPGFDAAAAAKQSAMEFLAGFVVEKSLAVDNLFVFVVVFSYFGIPAIYQHRVLFFGILGALVFRAIFIALGAVLMQYQAVVIFFGVFLIFTGIKMLFAPEKPIEPEKNPVIKILKKIMPISTKMDGHNFFHIENGVRYATPLLVALVFMEFTDIIFAVDSVPAIFALTKEPLIVFTSNIFAILGLRSMYFMLAGVMDKFHYLKFGLAFVLMFVGLKMVWLNKVFDGHFPITWSLAIIAGIIALSVIASFVFPKKELPIDPKTLPKK